MISNTWIMCCGYRVKITTLGIEVFLVCRYFIYLSFYFKNLSKVYLRTCTHAFVVMNQHVSRKVCVFNLALASTGVFWKIYQGLRSVLEGSTRFFPPTLYEGAPNVYEELDCALHAIGSGGSISIFLEVLDPVVRSNAHLTALSLRQSCGLVLWHLVPFKKGLQFSQRDFFAIVRDAPGIIIPDFWYCRPLTKKVSREYSTFSPMGFILIHISSYSVEEERIK